MTYFSDLSDYVYSAGSVRTGTKAVGWLAPGHEFPTATPDEVTLDLLWLYCSISVAPMRGIHDCEFCPGQRAYQAERNGQRLLLGAAEIRVFSNDAKIYAAPTLIYHYVVVHSYRPPDEFLQALREGRPRLPSQEYVDALAGLNLEWLRTSRGAPRNRILLYSDAAPGGRNYLARLGTLSDIERTQLRLKDGLIVHFYRPESDGENMLLFEGTVHFESERNQWYATIDDTSYRRECDPNPCGGPIGIVKTDRRRGFTG
jgi:hypothetical protein